MTSEEKVMVRDANPHAEESAKAFVSAATKAGETFKQAVESNAASSKAVIDACSKNMDSLRKKIEDPNSTTEDVREYMSMIEAQQDRQVSAAESQREHDREMAGKAALFGAFSIAIAAALLDPKQAAQYCRAVSEFAPRALVQLKAPVR